MKRNLVLGICAAATLALSGCFDKDLYDPAKAQKMKSVQYAANFAMHFGEVPADYSWDASSARSFWAATTRAVNDCYTTSDYEEVQPEILSWLNEKLVEGKREDGTTNKKLYGRSFLMIVPNNEFTIMPLYQGKASTKSFDFCVVVDDQPVKVWSKSQDLEVCDAVFTRTTVGDEWELQSQTDWRPVSELGNSNSTSGTECMKMNTIQTVTYPKGQTETNALQKTVNNYKVRAKKYTFDLTEYAGHQMYFYLETTANNNTNGAKKGDKQASTQGMMVALDDCPIPDNLEEGVQAMVIGCEASSSWSQSNDWDMNEVVFLMYGKPYNPEIIEIKDDKADEVYAKRYMFEDLGSTDDFDFNDLVIDLRDIRTIQLRFENGVKTSEKVVAYRQEAVVRNLGGTLPFEFRVGDKPYYKGGSPVTFGSKPNKTIVLYQTEAAEGGELSAEDCTGPWKPAENNVSLVVNQALNDGTFTSFTIPFPEMGCAAPMVIATDVRVDWMGERVSITPEWFNSIKEN